MEQSLQDPSALRDETEAVALLECQSMNHEFASGRRKVIVGLCMAIVLCSASQLCWKSATMGIPEGTAAIDTLRITFMRPLFWCAAVLYIWQFFNWMMVLKHADLSFAQPILAATYVVVGAAAWLVFNESLPPHRLAGILMILAGVVLISRSPYRSTQVPSPIRAGAGEVAP